MAVPDVPPICEAMMLLDIRGVADLLGLGINTVYVYRSRHKDTFPNHTYNPKTGRMVWDRTEIVEWATAEKVGRFKYE